MENILQAFQQLFDAIRHLGEDAKRESPATEERYRKFVVETTVRTNTGMTPSKFHFEEASRFSWHNAYFRVEKQIKQQPQFQHVISELCRSFGDRPNLEHFASYATALLVSDYFSDKERNLGDFIELLRKDIQGEPILYWTDMDVVGFETWVPKMEIMMGSKKIIIRQPELNDFQQEHSDYSPFPSPLWTVPSCYLRIETLSCGQAVLQLEAMRAEIILRLFSVCACTFTKQSFRSESVAKFVGGIMGPSPKSVGATFQLRPEQELLFKQFWIECNKRVSVRFNVIPMAQDDFWGIAYSRYSDALFHIGRPEGKIALAVMGLEAIFLGDEKDELKYRLSLRIAKMFIKIGSNADDLRKRIRAGYDIRSIFVHGGHLTTNQRGKYEKQTNLKIQELATSLMNDLRRSLLCMLLTNLEKKKMIDLIEDSLLDVSRDKEIEGILAPWKHFVQPADDDHLEVPTP
jgi:Apea-like HEPN